MEEPNLMDESPRRPVVTFGALMLMLAGTINVLEGVVGIANSARLNHDVLFANVQAWGWFFA